MDFESELNWKYHFLFSQITDDICDKIVNKVMRHYQSVKYNRQGTIFHNNYDDFFDINDCDLINEWDVICIDSQITTHFHDAFIRKIEKYIFDSILPTLSKREKLLIWMQTDSFDEWLCEAEEQYNDGVKEDFDFMDDYDDDSVIEYIAQCVDQKAGDYTNKRIELYLYSRLEE